MQAPQPLGSSRARPRALAESLPENQPLSRPRQSGTANMLRARTNPPDARRLPLSPGSDVKQCLPSMCPLQVLYSYCTVLL